MSFMNAVAELRSKWGDIKDHIAEEKAGVAEIAEELREEIEELEAHLKYTREYAKETLRDERRWVRGIIKGYIREHASSLFYGALADVKRGADFAVNFLIRYLWQFPIALIVWALLIISAGLISLGTFSLSAGKEFLEDIVQ